MKQQLKKKLLKIKGYSIEGVWILLGQILSVIGSLASVKILTNYLTPSEYGDLYLSLTIVTFGAQIIFGPINQSCLRFYSPSVESRHFKLFNKVTVHYYKLAFYIISLLLIGGLLFVIYTAVSEKWITLLILASIYAILNGINNNLDQIQNAARQRIIVAWHSGISSWLRVLIAYFAIIIFYNNAITVLCGFIVSQTVVYFSQYFFFQTRIKNKLIEKDLKYDYEKEEELKQNFFKYGWPFALWGIFTWLQQSADRWVLKYFHGGEAIGYFMVIYQLGYQPARIGSRIITKFLAPILFEKSGDATDSNRNKTVFKTNLKIVITVLIITLITFVGASFLYEFIFELFVDQRYWEYSYLLPYMVMAGGFFTASQLSSLTIMSRMDSKRLLIPKIITSVLCVALYVLLSSQYGVTGIVYSYLIFSCIQFLWIFLIKIKVFGEDYSLSP